MRHIPLAAVEEAASAVYAAAVRTPLVRLDLPFPVDAEPRAEVYLKLECLQPIGSFKLRGAYNAVRRLGREALAGGVWTVSAGNAAQGVAFAARLVGVPCSVMVMDTAPETKVRAIERLGASIVRASYDECWRTVETHRSDRMQGISSTRSTTTRSSPATPRPASRSSRISPTSTRWSPRSAAAGCWPASRR